MLPPAVASELLKRTFPEAGKQHMTALADEARRPLQYGSDNEAMDRPLRDQVRQRAAFLGRRPPTDAEKRRNKLPSNISCGD
jgi:hypothetical protein